MITCAHQTFSQVSNLMPKTYDDNIFDCLQLNAFDSQAYGRVKLAAQRVAEKYGCEWAKSHTHKLESIKLGRKIRASLMQRIPRRHSNKSVVWSRFKKYAVEWHNKNSAISQVDPSGT